MIQFIGGAWMHQYVTLEWIAKFVQPLPQSSYGNPSSWFQQIVMDIFPVGQIAYLACTYGLTDWLILCHIELGHATTSKLMSICRQLFQTYGTPDELSTDSSPPFIFCIFQEFLKMWCIQHRPSLVAYPQSNGQVDLMVKVTKRIVNGNTGP